MFKSSLNLISEVFQSVWSLISAVFLFVFEMLSALHFDYPRLEGLLVGVILAWVLSRRESHPMMKLASAPLKLILDILDLAWDKGVGSILSIFNSAKNKISNSVSWCFQKTKSGYNYIMKKLNLIKDDLEE